MGRKDRKTRLTMLMKHNGWLTAMTGTDNVLLYDPWGGKKLYTVDEAWEIQTKRDGLFKEVKENEAEDQHS